MTAIENSEELFRRTYRGGWLVFGYGLAWFIILGAGYALIAQRFAPGSSTGTILLAAIASALAGGMGGATAMLQRLARHLAVEQNFQNQPLWSYLLQPLTGLITGILSLFLVALPGVLLVTYAATRMLDIAAVADSFTFAALQLLLAWIAGYYYQGWLIKERRSDLPASKMPVKLDQSLPQTVSTNPASDSLLDLTVWVAQQQRMNRWSLTWGILILVYGLIWLLVLFAGFLGSGRLFPSQAADNQPLVNLLAAGWPAVLAGGMGGVIGMLYDLYRRVSFARGFDRQHIIAYLTLPFTGLVLGGAIYLFIASGYLSLKSLLSQNPPLLDTPAVIISYIVLGWTAGFRQQALQGLIRRVIQSVIDFFRFCRSRLSPKLIWDEAKRADTLSDIAKQQELFKLLERDSSSPGKR